MSCVGTAGTAFSSASMSSVVFCDGVADWAAAIAGSVGMSFVIEGDGLVIDGEGLLATKGAGMLAGLLEADGAGSGEGTGSGDGVGAAAGAGSGEEDGTGARVGAGSAVGCGSGLALRGVNGGTGRVCDP